MKGLGLGLRRPLHFLSGEQDTCLFPSTSGEKKKKNMFYLSPMEYLDICVGKSPLALITSPGDRAKREPIDLFSS